jgi:hypothetical protein
MQLISGKAPINSDWVLNKKHHKSLSIFCGIWDKGDVSPTFAIRLCFEHPQNHQAIEFELSIWRFNLEMCIYDMRHWNNFRNKFINNEQDQLEYEADYKKEEETTND